MFTYSRNYSSAGRSGIDQWNFVNRPDDGKSRDPHGSYVRKWVPELRKLPIKHLCRPFLAPPQVLEEAGVVLGSNYPFPIVTDLNRARTCTTEFTIECRRQFQNYNDAYGYDYIDLPDFTQTKVFTKKEFRIDKQGKRLYGGDDGGSSSSNRGSAHHGGGASNNGKSTSRVKGSRNNKKRARK